MVYKNILKEPPTYDDLANLARLASTNIAGLINPRSRVFKAMKVDVTQMADEAVAALITQNPRIMIRPLLSDGTSIVLGFKREEMSHLIDK